MQCVVLNALQQLIKYYTITQEKISIIIVFTLSMLHNGCNKIEFSTRTIWNPKSLRIIIQVKNLTQKL